MRYSILSVVTLAVIASFHPADAEQRIFFTPPLVTAPVLTTTPTIDGLVDAEEWTGAGTISPFISLGGQSDVSAQTEIWVGYDNRQLYIGAIMHDPQPDKIKADATVRDGAVCEDDCLQLFFDPADNGDTYIHLAINSAGVRYDALMQDETVDYRWEAKTATTGSGWSAELILPFEGEIAPSPGSVWGFAVARFVPHLDELSASSRMITGFHEPDNFGKLVFLPQAASMKMATLGSRSLGDNTAVLVVSNFSEKTFAGKVNVRVTAPSSYGDYYGVEKINVEQGRTNTVRVPYKIAQDGANIVQFSLTDAEGKTVSRTAPYPLALPPVGVALRELETALAAALRVWSVLDDSDYKQEAGDKIAELLGQWRSLSGKYQTQRRRMTTDELSELETELMDVTADVKQLREQLDAHIQTSLTDLEAYPVSALADIDLSPSGYRPFSLARLDAARNSQTAMQLVISPFPGRPRAG
jgi:hypothetical protein